MILQDLRKRCWHGRGAKEGEGTSWRIPFEGGCENRDMQLEVAQGIMWKGIDFGDKRWHIWRDVCDQFTHVSLRRECILNMELVHGITAAAWRPCLRRTKTSSVRRGFVPVPALRPSSARVLRPCQRFVHFSRQEHSRLRGWPGCHYCTTRRRSQSGERSGSSSQTPHRHRWPTSWSEHTSPSKLQTGTSLPRLASNTTIPCVSSAASGSSSKEWDPATFLCYLCQTWFHFQFGLPWRTPFATMPVLDPTSSDDENFTGAVTMEELTLAHHVFVGEVVRRFGVCYGAVKIACVCQFTVTVSVMERELHAPHVILLRVSFRSWLRQPLCQSCATALRRKGSFSVCVYTSIFISFDGLAHAALQSKGFGSSGLRSAICGVAPFFRSVQLWTVRAHAPFKRLGSVSGRDVTIL